MFHSENVRQPLTRYDVVLLELRHQNVHSQAVVQDVVDDFVQASRVFAGGAVVAVGAGDEDAMDVDAELSECTVQVSCCLLTHAAQASSTPSVLASTPSRATPPPIGLPMSAPSPAMSHVLAFLYENPDATGNDVISAVAEAGGKYQISPASWGCCEPCSRRRLHDV